MSKFKLTYDRGCFFYVLETASGEAILAGRHGYGSKSTCKNTISSVRVNSQKDHHFDIKKTPDNKFFVELRAINGTIVGTSTMYETEDRAKACKAKVKAISPDAELVDLVL